VRYGGGLSLRRVAVAALAAALLAAAFAAAITRGLLHRPGPLPAFEDQACALPPEWLTLIQRGIYPGRTGEISLLPRFPAYMASGAGGWTHSGPWPYVVDIPLVFYGPDRVPAVGEVDTPATLADVAPTIATFMHGVLSSEDGRSLDEVVTLEQAIEVDPPKLILTIVWDGGGWNTLERWSDSWPSLRRVMEGGVSYINANVGSSPSVTPPVHTTLGTGFFPWKHGITAISQRDDEGNVVDAFMRGESSRLIEIPTIAERWSSQTDGGAKIGMVGYEPWHLGMIGQGAEGPAGQKHHAAWLDHDTNEWITNPDHYTLPPALPATGGLDEDLRELDAADGRIDGAWGEHEILDDRSRIEETPAFVKYHGRALRNLIIDEGYGQDEVTDLLFTNFKQIDRVGHFFNFESDEVRQVLEETDRVLGELIEFLEREIGRGDYVVIVTADHGQQPDAPAIDAHAIAPGAVREAIEHRYGPVVRSVWPTEIFLEMDEVERRDLSIEEIAHFVGDHRLRDNTGSPIARRGIFGPADRLFDLAVPTEILPGLTCD
jgi:arylsulfatase A-like enzyme